MLIRCWGSRGGLPVSGTQYRKYGGETTCMEVRSGSGGLIIFDAGTGIVRLGAAMIKEKVKRADLVFTHAHWDHLMGFCFFRPAFTRGFELNIYGNPFTVSSYRKILKGLMSAPYFPVGLDELQATISFHTVTRPFSLEGIEIVPINLSHPNRGLGFRLEENGTSFVFLTDNELGFTHPDGLRFEEYAEFSRDADLLIHDAEFTRKEYRAMRSWGHSHIDDAIRLAIKSGAKRLGLFHHHRDRSDDDIDRAVEDARMVISRSRDELSCFAVGNTFEMRL